MARITKLQGAILDSQRLPVGRVPGWHESLNCREQFRTAAGCPQGECLDGTSQYRSSNVSALSRSIRLSSSISSQTRRKYVLVGSNATAHISKIKKAILSMICYTLLKLI